MQSRPVERVRRARRHCARPRRNDLCRDGVRQQGHEFGPSRQDPDVGAVTLVAAAGGRERDEGDCRAGGDGHGGGGLAGGGPRGRLGPARSGRSLSARRRGQRDIAAIDLDDRRHERLVDKAENSRDMFFPCTRFGCVLI